jgi:hypothetical protein
MAETAYKFVMSTATDHALFKMLVVPNGVAAPLPSKVVLNAPVPDPPSSQ